MWSGTRRCRALFKHGKSLCRVWKHDFMSASFRCEGIWDNRLKSALLQKVNLDNMFYEIDNKYNLTKAISAVDVDLFVNAVNDNSHIDEMEDIVLRLRLSPEATNIFPSTHHAFIRAYLTHGEPNDLIRVLSDRLNYGIFPDCYCYILLLDHFLDKGDFRNAAKVATLQMLQEEFSNDLLKYMSAYSCYKYLSNPTEWEEKIEESAEKDDGEEIKVRVKYIRNPYFDNHFDLRNPNSLLGKTLLMIGNNIDSSIKNDLILLGSCLLRDWDKALTLVNTALNDKQSVTKTTIDLVKKYMPGETDDGTAKDESYQELIKSLEALKSENLDMLDFLESSIKQEIPVGENIAQEQIKIYEEWDNIRETSLREEIDKLEKYNKLESIKKKKQELLDREQELYFFDHEDEIDIAIENKKVRYPPKWQGKKKKKKVTEDYVPPEITKQRSSS